MSTVADSAFDDAANQREAARLGIWTFIATEVLFFGPVFLAYVYGRYHEGAAFAEASRHTHIWLGTLNTALLLTSSFTIALAVHLEEQGRHAAKLRFLAATMVLGVVFLAVKGWEYSREWNEGLVPVQL